ncbi:MAG: hypothetical protein JXM74_06505 [Fusobacteriaceae bacterium]|nr:hypothetical protein [Fusobacteriaceae bacterium]MBN2838391.1 hypothetical protein [Fusobacteriaceae bacterium]
MRNCVRCGKEIDVFSKNPEKIFYCKKCSLELLNIDEEKIFQKDEEKEYSLIPESFTLYLLVPGTFQLQSERLFKACSYFYSAIFFPVSWFVFLFLFLGQNSVTKYDKKPLYFLSFMVIIGAILVYISNFKEVKNGVNRS